MNTKTNKSDDKLSNRLLVLQALSISATAIIEACLGISLPLLILHAIAQGAKLIRDADRAQKSGK